MGEYFGIPVDAFEIFDRLTNEQLGLVFTALCKDAFEGVKLEITDPQAKEAFDAVRAIIVIPTDDE